MRENTVTESGVDAELLCGEVRVIPESVSQVEVDRPGDARVLRLSVRSESASICLMLGPEQVEALQERLAAESVDPEQIDATG